MNIENVPGERGRYYCHSETNDDETHVVDLTENEGWGECSCSDWTFRKAKAHREGENSYDKGMCKHLREVHIFHSIETLSNQSNLSRPKPVSIRESNDSLPF